ncbi:Gibberellin 2-beta-dioxygenase 1 [Capsicum annuum]|uniref:gibberellin 2-beta-dioxygenase 1 isoform X2 n=1 Tax=Capsicum annuum TaxID=4072 RepID=UPI001FB07E89|nr:gibberellin 2-beta-dioxygenase 1 isoform X2 [Capsicum annuum]KAF3681017.1 Gibberellin 2-beta-dioxygenase 1 [Capsicum annuum]KAF3683119.1 Gibberellin 2-beta-dioxygenase 1 [Capsicum annuum]
MVVLTTPSIDHFPIVDNSFIDPSLFNDVPIIDLSEPDSINLIVKACEEFGFFKVINHDVPMEFISKLESEANKFFSSPLSEKLKAGPAEPFGYGNKQIGPNGDIGWVEHILVPTNSEFNYQKFASISSLNPDNIRAAVNDYVTEVKKMACEVLEMLAEGLKIHQRNVFSKLLMDEKSDSVFRVNHYASCSEIDEFNGNNVIGFGEHTDPQIISILRSNNTSGLQILLKNGHWISVPPDPISFFINVGDSLQVMTNGRFKSVKHRVLTNSVKSRLSMIYFGGPPLNEKIAPLPSLLEGKDSLYKEFTWLEYKKSAYKSKLADNRLVMFEKMANS